MFRVLVLLIVLVVGYSFDKPVFLKGSNSESLLYDSFVTKGGFIFENNPHLNILDSKPHNLLFVKPNRIPMRDDKPLTYRHAFRSRNIIQVAQNRFRWGGVFDLSFRDIETNCSAKLPIIFIWIICDKSHSHLQTYVFSYGAPVVKNHKFNRKNQALSQFVGE